MATTLHAERVVDGFTYGEGPRWHGGRLWFTDNHAGAVMTLGPSGRLEVAARTGQPSGLGWLPDGTLLVSTLGRAALERFGPDGARSTLDLSSLAWSTNDMVAGPGGLVYVDLYRLADDGMSGAVAVVPPGGEARVVTEDVTLPNGLGITPDGSTLLVSDTGAQQVLAFGIDADGGLRDRRVFADLGPGANPDGLCVDAAGAVWVGSYDAEVFVRVEEGGEVTHRVETGGGWAVAPALGGDDRRTLYLVIDETTVERMLEGDSSGRIEAVRVDVPGVGWP